ncbi:rod shape-determining protein RodA [Thalassospira marina]|uniref:Peptidoglycan glycosyltransferase MrdB n=1 Tax=Thalassospira marina TaxID=2048283 RepID=A0A2N3KZW6_9PROT|nr:rod shape-determining protein RodA [Thalassospira marina]AUG52198.1 rod shape-determining protein RodA [Thalassospira marina]PKR56119.1 rod shape-determining protein RodA [Thalassospira marina]
MAARYRIGQDPDYVPLGRRLLLMNWTLVLLLAILSCIGFAMLYSAANGSLQPWAERQMMRFAAGMVLMILIALTDVRVWLRMSYAAYVISLILLVGVEIKGDIGMGAQRWINLGFFQLQPSELMKISLVLALARYFHGLTIEETGRIPLLIPPLLMVLAPAALVLRQPDLGTALLLVAGGGVIFWLSGVRMWKFAIILGGALAAIPIGWQFLRDYQKNRVLTFLNPENDPLGAGYHITQSKIALGSGGLFGKGFMLGSQSHLNFLPEKQTDFIFTMLGEEFGLVGGIALLLLYTLVIVYGYVIALRCANQFGRLVAIGVTTTFFLYVFINIAMVMGLIPVVGVPLPLVSYGGTVMMTILVSFGLLMSISIHRDVRISRQGNDDGRH